MSGSPGFLVRVVAFLTGRTPEDWAKAPGDLFRKVLAPIVAAGKKHIDADKVAEIGARSLEAPLNKVEAETKHEQMAGLKTWAEAEEIKANVELKRRAIQAEVRKKNAEAAKAEIEVYDTALEAKKKEIEVRKAEYELRKILKKHNAAISFDDLSGSYFLMPAPPSLDYVAEFDDSAPIVHQAIAATTAEDLQGAIEDSEKGEWSLGVKDAADVGKTPHGLHEDTEVIDFHRDEDALGPPLPTEVLDPHLQSDTPEDEPQSTDDAPQQPEASPFAAIGGPHVDDPTPPTDPAP